MINVASVVFFSHITQRLVLLDGVGLAAKRTTRHTRKIKLVTKPYATCKVESFVTDQSAR